MCSSAGPMSLQKASRRTIAVQKFASIIRDRRSWEKVTSGWSRRRSISSPSTAIWTPVTTTSTSGRLASVAYWRAAFSGYHTSSSSQNETSGASVAATPALRPPGRPGVWSFASTRTRRSPRSPAAGARVGRACRSPPRCRRSWRGLSGTPADFFSPRLGKSSVLGRNRDIAPSYSPLATGAGGPVRGGRTGPATGRSPVPGVSRPRTSGGSMRSARQLTSRRSFRRIGQCLVAAVTAVTALGIGAIDAAQSAAPAGAVTIARDGLTSQTAAPSCWSIKQAYPASADGVYWLWTPKLTDPQQFFCDMTTDGGGWVLVGRGREGWSFPYWGQGSPSTLRTTIDGTGAFSPASLPTPTVDGLLNGGRMDALTDGVRLRRATNTAGTSFQEVRMHIKTYGQWSWAFGGGIYLDSISFDGTTTAISNSNWQTNTTADVQVSNDTRRVTTYPQPSHNYQGGFSLGGNVVGQNNATSYLWQYASENAAIPFTQVWLRPQISDADIAAAGATFAPDSGTAATTVQKLLDRNPTSLPWAVTNINPGTSAPTVYFYVKTFAQIGNTIYVGGKFRQVQHGQGGPTFTQSYLAAFDKDTGEWMPSFNPVIDGPVWKVKASPDGTKLFVGGEFTNVNGVANTSGLAALDPTTGAPARNWMATTSWPSGSNDVRAMDIDNGWLYIAGSFTRVAGGATDFVGPLTVSRLA